MLLLVGFGQRGGYGGSGYHGRHRTQREVKIPNTQGMHLGSGLSDLLTLVSDSAFGVSDITDCAIGDFAYHQLRNWGNSSFGSNRSCER